MPGALEGVRILDFTRYQQGPFATVLLSDLGADVIKVEEPAHGDIGRSLGLQPDGFCAYFQALNRNKRSLTVDTRTTEGREIIYKLVPGMDVVTDNFRPGTMKRFGLDHDALTAINPRIVTASASGFGPEGATAHEPSFDSIGQAMGGSPVGVFQQVLDQRLVERFVPIIRFTRLGERFDRTTMANELVDVGDG